VARPAIRPPCVNQGTRVFDNLREDFKRYHHIALQSGPRLARVRAALAYGFLAVALYRYGRWTRTISPWLLSLPFKIVYLLLKVPLELTLGIDITTNSNIGPGLYIGHFGGVFVHCDAGRNLSLGQDVTLGYKGAGRSNGWPQVGNDVYLGTGSKVIGRVTLGDGVIVGANTVVTKDVPAYTRVVGAAVRMTPLAAPDASQASADDA
jgi:serine O-acetyltransferase